MGARSKQRRVTVPALIIGGWYDYFLSATLAHYQGIKQHGGSAEARRPRLILGPWAHVDFPGMFAERDYGPSASTRATNRIYHDNARPPRLILPIIERS